MCEGLSVVWVWFHVAIFQYAGNGMSQSLHCHWIANLEEYENFINTYSILEVGL